MILSRKPRTEVICDLCGTNSPCLGREASKQRKYVFPNVRTLINLRDLQTRALNRVSVGESSPGCCLYPNR